MVVFTLAIGIAACTSIFSVVNAILFQALPYQDTDRLAFLWTDDPHTGTDGLVASFPDYLDWKRETRSFSGMAAFNVSSAHLTGGSYPEEIWGAVVTHEFFSVLGVQPVLGRSFSTAEADEQGVLLSHRLWQRRFGESPSVLGSKVILSGKPYIVLGVLPPDFQHPEPFWRKDADFWRVLHYDPATMTRDSRFLRVIGRLGSGASLEAATSDLRGVARQFDLQRPADQRGSTPYVMPLRQQLFGDLRRPLFLMLATAGVVLLIVCANVANMQLARSLSRLKEFAVRTTLGARPTHILRQSFAESLFLAVLGGALGLLLSFWGTRLLISVSPADVPGLHQTVIDGRVLLFSAALTLFAAVAAGVLPSLHLLRPNIGSLVKSGGRTSTGQAAGWARTALVVGEISLTLPLLISSTLLARSALELSSVDPGFHSDHMLTFRLSLPSSRYTDTLGIHNFYSGLLQDIESLPGVTSVALVSSVPLTGLNNQIRNVFPEETSSASKTASIHYRVVAGDYFRTMGIPLTEGRAFDLRNEDRDRTAILISRAFARAQWPGESALGKRLRLGDGSAGEPWLSVVGVVGDVRDGQLSADPEPVLYLPYVQDSWKSMAVVMRLSLAPDEIAESVRRTVWQRDPELPLADVQTLEEVVSASTLPSRFQAFSVCALAGLAVALALTGIFGVLSYYVGERTREFGIRLAIGAARRNIVGLVLRHACVLALPGLAVGLVLSLLSSRILAHTLYGIAATDTVSLAGGAFLLLIATLFTASIPALRATQADPILSLKRE